MARLTVRTDTSGFRQFRADLDRAVQAGLAEAARDYMAAAKSVPLRGYDIERIVSDVRVTPVKRSRRGWDVALVWNDFRAIFFAKGTSHGIKAVRFIQRPARETRKRLPDYIGRALR